MCLRKKKERKLKRVKVCKMGNSVRHWRVSKNWKLKFERRVSGKRGNLEIAYRGLSFVEPKDHLARYGNVWNCKFVSAFVAVSRVQSRGQARGDRRRLERYYWFTYCRESYINPRRYILFSNWWFSVTFVSGRPTGTLLYLRGELHLTYFLRMRRLRCMPRNYYRTGKFANYVTWQLQQLRTT